MVAPHHTNDGGNDETDNDADEADDAPELVANGRRRSVAQHDDVVASVGPWSTHAGRRGGIPAKADPANWESDYRAGTPPLRRKGETLAQQEERHSRTEEGTRFSTQVRRQQEPGNKADIWQSATTTDGQARAPELDELGGGNPEAPHEAINPYTRLDQDQVAFVNAKGADMADKYGLDPVEVKRRLAWAVSPKLTQDDLGDSEHIPVGKTPYMAAMDDLDAIMHVVKQYTGLKVGADGINPQTDDTASLTVEITNIYTDPKRGTAKAGKGRDEHGNMVHWIIWEDSLKGQYDEMNTCLNDMDEPDKQVDFEMGDSVTFTNAAVSEYNGEVSLAVTSKTQVRINERSETVRATTRTTTRSTTPTQKHTSDAPDTETTGYELGGDEPGEITTELGAPSKDHAFVAARR